MEFIQHSICQGYDHSPFGSGFIKCHRKVQLFLLIFISGGYLLSYLFLQEGVYEQSPEMLRFFYLMNAITVIVILSLFINYYSKSTLKAETKLREEKEITVSQNKQLINQYESLVTERDKTHKMLNKRFNSQFLVSNSVYEVIKDRN